MDCDVKTRDVSGLRYLDEQNENENEKQQRNSQLKWISS